jgi:predicted GIY-YIG superfamily endonuclease
MFYVYLLQSSSGCTYIGATIDLDRRLDQHNKLLKGGAKATGNRVERGEMWVRMGHVKNFPDWQSALQFEWRWKQLSRNVNEKKPLKRRACALKQLLSLERSTSKAIPYSEWEIAPEVVMEDDEFREYFILL